MMDARLLWRALRARYRDNRTELNAIASQLRPHDLVCDIGANKGSFLYWLSRWTRRGRVVAFEPQPELSAYLRARFSAASNVTIESKGVYFRTEDRYLYVPSNNSPGATLSNTHYPLGTNRIVVPVVSLDDYFNGQRYPDILKIDVEGAELDVFRGADRILSQRKPFIVFECEQRHLPSGTVFDAFRYLEAKGYRGHFINGSSLSPISDFSPETNQRQGYGRFWEASGYCNNFVFASD